MTDAGSTTTRSPASSRSRRAARSAWMLGGIWRRSRSRVALHMPPSRTSAPSSMSIDMSCSTNSGFPSAAATTFASTAAGIWSPPVMLAISCVDAPSGSRPRSSRIAFGPSLHSGWGSSMSGRAVHTIRIDRASTRSTRCSTSSSSVGAAQCTSSMTMTTGPESATRSSSSRMPQNSSARGRSSSLQPRADATRRATSASPIIASTRTPGSDSRSSMPTASRTMASIGQKVIDSP